jgi:gamma-glutamyltranspeptidase/glutathione hydrolase
MVSFIQSNFKGFGSGVVVPGTGIALHNRGMGFVTPGHPNQVAGGKRPMHSIIPAFMLRNGQPHMAFGVMGGNMQAQGHLQMTLREAVEGLNPRLQRCAALAHQRCGALTLEHTVPAAVVEGLRAWAMRPRLRRLTAWTSVPPS